ncbi:MAG: GntR family transcriptional regulator [Lachnospiraceae bacterium]|nr:GntR family transcriptional regulator [Lachnospiraceae bacterium]
MEMTETKIKDYMPLRDVVFVTLRREILRGDLKPGERLMEIDLANKLGVSRTPIREAIRKLEHEGLVVMIPRRGAHVADITQQELEDVLEIRLSLEVLAIEKACSRMTEKDIRALKQAEAEFAELVERGEVDLERLGEADERFHGVIYEGTGNRRLIQILNNLREQMYRFRVEYLKQESVRKTLVDEHDSIIRALQARDKDQAVALTRNHINNQYEAIRVGLVSRGNKDGEGREHK